MTPSSVDELLTGTVIRMARTARKLGESGIYHVMLRGINQSELFYDSDDRQAFLQNSEGQVS